jgi:hypothetical protein
MSHQKKLDYTRTRGRVDPEALEKKGGGNKFSHRKNNKTNNPALLIPQSYKNLNNHQENYSINNPPIPGSKNSRHFNTNCIIQILKIKKSHKSPEPETMSPYQNSPESHYKIYSEH